MNKQINKQGSAGPMRQQALPAPLSTTSRPKHLSRHRYDKKKTSSNNNHHHFSCKNSNTVLS